MSDELILYDSSELGKALITPDRFKAIMKAALHDQAQRDQLLQDSQRFREFMEAEKRADESYSLEDFLTAGEELHIDRDILDYQIRAINPEMELFHYMKEFDAKFSHTAAIKRLGMALSVLGQTYDTPALKNQIVTDLQRAYPCIKARQTDTSNLTAPSMMQRLWYGDKTKPKLKIIGAIDFHTPKDQPMRLEVTAFSTNFIKIYGSVLRSLPERLPEYFNEVRFEVDM